MFCISIPDISQQVISVRIRYWNERVTIELRGFSVCSSEKISFTGDNVTNLMGFAMKTDNGMHSFPSRQIRVKLEIEVPNRLDPISLGGRSLLKLTAAAA